MAVPYRLPRTVLPRTYRLHLDADPAADRFAGRVTIDVDVTEPTAEARLHAKGLDVVSATAGGREAAVEVVEEREEVLLRFAAPLPAGPATLSLAYEAPVGQNMAGLYLSVDGDDRCLATQCEATDARAIFPCMDEPDMKAVFEVSVTAPTDQVVLANMPATGTADAGGGRTTHAFAPTPRMSTYLLAVAVGPFAATPPVTERGTDFRVWALGGKERLGTHARDLGTRLLPWYEDYFGQPYAFGKYDQIAVPSFAFGAMENPGLVVFRPSLVLVDPDASSWDARKDVALVVAHEFAHMWFGDLVTMAWWDDLWLNEAFAEWIAHKAAHAVDPDLDVWHHFRQRAAGAMATDALQSTHAIYHPVETPAEAAEMFDAITYGKGSAVMRMLEAYLGEDAFRAGLRTYMGAFALANARGADLWDHLGRASGDDVAAITGDWITQPGHPVVSVAWDAATRRLTLSQRRATSSPAVAPDDTLWRVPIVLRWEDDDGTHLERRVLADREATWELPVAGTLRWLWPNADDVGFYRSALDAPLREAILNAADRLTPAERIALLRDLWMETRAGKLEPSDFLAALDGLMDPGAPYDVLEHLVSVLGALERVLEGVGEDPAPFRRLVADRFAAAYQRMDPPAPDDNPRTRSRRATLLSAAVLGRDAAAITDARRIAAAERADAGAVESALAAAAVHAEAATGTPDDLAVHLDTYRTRRDRHDAPQDVERYLYRLGAHRDPRSVERVLETIGSGDVAAQAVGPILRGMLTAPHAARPTWTFWTTRWDELNASMGEAWLAILVEACGELPLDLQDEARTLLADRLEGKATQAHGRALERMEERAAFLPKMSAALVDWARGHA